MAATWLTIAACSSDPARVLPPDGGGTPDAGTFVCAPGERRCESDAAEICAADRNGFVIESACTAGCRDGTCLACEIDFAGCSGDDRLGCSNDRLEVVRLETCANGCVDGACLGCEPGGLRCAEDALERCEDGAWVMEASCSHGCADASCRACTPGERRCESGNAERCAEDGSGFRVEEACEHGCAGDGCAACAADFRACDGDARLGCADDRSAVVTTEQCAHGCAEGRCIGAVCDVDEARCDGDVLERCAADRRRFEVIEDCAFGCDAGACLDAVCASEETRCQEGRVVVCAADRRRFESGEICEFGCADGACSAATCELEERRCQGNTLLRCRDDRRDFISEQVCPVACRDAACAAPQLRLCVGAQCRNPYTTELGVIAAGASATVTADIGNDGNHPMRVLGLMTLGSGMLAPLALPPVPATLEPGEEISAQWRFAPQGAGPYRAWIVVETDDPEREDSLIPITGAGTERAERYLRMGLPPEEDAAFVPFAEGDRIPYHRGFQGQGHVFIAFRMRGVAATGRLKLLMLFGLRTWVSGVFQDVELTDLGGGELGFDEGRYVVAIPYNPQLIEGASVWLEAVYEDASGRVVSQGFDAETDVLLYDP